ncbi:DUF2271 domain-containing protein [Sphingobium sufflavum]|uniref:DUF2271 domain-containing protein n=1 Tax=Sphingobium sufflavum TaxID=1129547 RepID=UPI001F2E863C|nr:DUF2271 domain-containing protein [Sphingobium sufflavum]MCE7796917.1 DUF2271 domain-containing protein [Sphingobium sufflavum]
MFRPVSSRLKLAIAALLIGTSAPALAAPKEYVIEIEVPKIGVAEYHKPYVAGWVEDAEGKAVSHLLVWYDQKKRENGGKKWLPDMKTWWRKGGRSLAVPADGVSGATRAPGRATIATPAASSPLAKLPAGHYAFVVEASREGGGREVVKAPFAWKPGGTVSAVAKGTGELGEIKLSSR